MTTRADRIRERLEALGLSERAASMKAKLNPRFITDLLLNPDMSPRADNMRKLAEALETSADWLDRGVDVARIDAATAELIQLMPRLDDAARRRLVEIAKVEAKLSKIPK